MGTSGIHAQTEQRVICHACHTTFSARHGTVFYRRRTAAETVVRVVTVRAQGCRVHARVAAFGVDERTVAAWWARSGRPGQAGPESLIEHPRDLGQGQADELRVKNQGGMVWIALAMMVKTRLWLGGEVRAPRDLPLLRRLGARGRRWAARRPLVVCTAGLVSSSRAMRETFRAPVQTGKGGRPRRRPWRHGLIAPGGNHDERRRVVDTERHSGDGTPARVETRRRRSQGSGVLNPASSEPLNAPFRQRLAPRARRCRARARHTVTRPKGRVLVGPREHLCTPQERLSYPPKTPPAMAAAITDHGWTMQELLSCPVPLARWSPPTPRGRPSHALKGLIEPWSGNHGELWSYPLSQKRSIEGIEN